MKTEKHRTRRRIVAPSLFLAGGLLTWIVIGTLRTLGTSQAGMSAGPVVGIPNHDTLILWLFCSYFFVSAIGSALFVKKVNLIAVASLAYLLVIIAFCFACYEFFGSNFVVFAIVVIAYFLPWTALWANVVGNAKPTAPQ
jgi:hypothetical protein